MSDLAPILQGFFTDRLTRQKQVSPNTVAAYRDTCWLLLSFAHDKTAKAPSRLSLADLDSTLVGAFLQHLEEQRGNSSATRNARLAAIHSAASCSQRSGGPQKASPVLSGVLSVDRSSRRWPTARLDQAADRLAVFASIMTVSAIRPRPTASRKSSALAPLSVWGPWWPPSKPQWPITS